MNWETVKIETLCDQIRGVSYSQKDVGSELQENYFKILRANNIQNGEINLDKLVFVPKHCIKDQQFLKKKDILIAASSGSIKIVGKAACIKQDINGAFGAFCKVLRPNCKVDPLYFSFYFQSLEYRHIISNLAAGANINNLKNEHFDNLEILLPSLSEQKRIAGVLDNADEIRKKRQQAIRECDEFLKATFYDMFGDPVTNPKGWDVKALKDLCCIITNGTTPKGGKKVYEKEGITFFRSQNVWKNKLELDDIVFINEKTHFDMHKSSLKYEDILMTKTGRFNTENSSLGRAAMFLGNDNSANINGHVYLIRLNECIENEFVLYILITDVYRDYIRNISVGGIDKRQINKSHLEQFPIINPPLPLQQKFAKIFKHIEYMKADMQESLRELDDNFNNLMQKAFKGKL